MKKWLPIAFLVALFGFAANAQDEGIYRLYQSNLAIINPAYTGFNNTHAFHFNARSTFSGFDGSARNYLINYNGAVSNTIGLGVGLFSETIGELNRISVQTNYSFKQELDDFTLAAGLNLRFSNTQVPGTVYERYDMTVLESTDPLLNSYTDGRREFDAAFGFFARHRVGTYAGFTLLNLIQSKLENLDNNDNNLFQNFNVFVGHEFVVDDGFKVEPSFLFGNVLFSDAFYDANVKVKFLDDKIITGVSYRGGRGGSLGIILGTKFNSISAHYMYDLYMGGFQQYNAGSHELTLSFEFDRRK